MKNDWKTDEKNENLTGFKQYLFEEKQSELFRINLVYVRYLSLYLYRILELMKIISNIGISPLTKRFRYVK